MLYKKTIVVWGTNELSVELAAERAIRLGNPPDHTGKVRACVIGIGLAQEVAEPEKDITFTNYVKEQLEK